MTSARRCSTTARSIRMKRLAARRQPWLSTTVDRSLPPERRILPRCPPTRRLLILPGDGIGPEVMREVRRVIDWMDRRRMVTFDVSDDHVGGSAIDTYGTPITDETMQKAKDADAILFGSVGGPKWDKLGFAHAARDRHPAAAQGTRPVRQSASGHRAGPAGRRFDAEGRRGARARPDDRARKHGRHLFRRAARRSRRCPTAQQARLRHGDLYHQRDRAGRPHRLRACPQAAEPGVQRGEGQCHAVRPVLAADGDGAARAGVRRCRTVAHVCR